MEELQQRFNILRPEILETLSKNSFNFASHPMFYKFFQGDVAMKNLHMVWQNGIKTSTLLLPYVIEIRSIPRVKTHMLREYNPTFNDSKTILRQPSSSGVSNMVRDTLCRLLNVFYIIDRRNSYHVRPGVSASVIHGLVFQRKF